jgi:hypothetical protein
MLQIVSFVHVLVPLGYRVFAGRVELEQVEKARYVNCVRPVWGGGRWEKSRIRPY